WCDDHGVVGKCNDATFAIEVKNTFKGAIKSIRQRRQVVCLDPAGHPIRLEGQEKTKRVLLWVWRNLVRRQSEREKADEEENSVTEATDCVKSTELELVPGQFNVGGTP
ncbi:MAG: hypothetical protein L0170_17540, partial [Acidobacteria bacterium]|nr:hypothetical protein [Acidobacteriota bacterium]